MRFPWFMHKLVQITCKEKRKARFEREASGWLGDWGAMRHTTVMASRI